jgi:plasmid stabilization system protein ParE
MKRVPVLILPVVRAQIEAQVIYIAAHSVTNALAWEDRLPSAIDRIGDTKGYRVNQQLTDGAGETIRTYVFERTYLIHYRVVRDELIEGISFRHGARLSDGKTP